MKQLDLYVCENFYPQFTKILEDKEFRDFNVIAFPSLCDHKNKKEMVTKILQTTNDSVNEGILMCSRFCDAIHCMPENGMLETITSEYCFSNLINESMISYIIQKGGYLVSDGWLMNWQERLQSAGFDKQSAQKFYQEFCKELVYLDSGVNPDAKNVLLDLSNFLGIPFTTLTFEANTLKALLKSVIYRWKLLNGNKESALKNAELQSQNAEYSALFEIVSRISTYTSKRETIAAIKEMFVSIFGAQRFNFWIPDSESVPFPKELESLLHQTETNYQFFKESNRFCISVRFNTKVFGILDVGDFLFPQYIKKYLNLALEISKVCALVLSNIEQYELLQKSERSFEFLSYHDALTSLNNRAYVNRIISNQKRVKNCAVFAFDIDLLKNVNDTFGHEEGDQLIILAAEVLRESFRETDLVARIGGDEFLAIVFDCEENDVMRIFSRISSSIEAKNEKLTNKPWELKISKGFSYTGDVEREMENLIQDADQKMYSDKHSNKALLNNRLK